MIIRCHIQCKSFQLGYQSNSSRGVGITIRKMAINIQIGLYLFVTLTCTHVTHRLDLSFNIPKVNQRSPCHEPMQKFIDCRPVVSGLKHVNRHVDTPAGNHLNIVQPPHVTGTMCICCNFSGFQNYPCNRPYLKGIITKFQKDVQILHDKDSPALLHRIYGL